jgi:hypothetical protein
MMSASNRNLRKQKRGPLSNGEGTKIKIVRVG